MERKRTLKSSKKGLNLNAVKLRSEDQSKKQLKRMFEYLKTNQSDGDTYGFDCRVELNPSGSYWQVLGERGVGKTLFVLNLLHSAALEEGRIVLGAEEAHIDCGTRLLFLDAKDGTFDALDCTCVEGYKGESILFYEHLFRTGDRAPRVEELSDRVDERSLLVVDNIHYLIDNILKGDLTHEDRVHLARKTTDFFRAIKEIKGRKIFISETLLSTATEEYRKVRELNSKLYDYLPRQDNAEISITLHPMVPNYISEDVLLRGVFSCLGYKPRTCIGIVKTLNTYKFSPDLQGLVALTCNISSGERKRELENFYRVCRTISVALEDVEDDLKGIENIGNKEYGCVVLYDDLKRVSSYIYEPVPLGMMRSALEPMVRQFGEGYSHELLNSNI